MIMETATTARAHWRPLHFRAPWPRQAHKAAARTPCWGWKPPHKGRPMAAGNTSQAVTATAQHGAKPYLGKNLHWNSTAKEENAIAAMSFSVHAAAGKSCFEITFEGSRRQACHNSVSTTSELRHWTQPSAQHCLSLPPSAQPPHRLRPCAPAFCLGDERHHEEESCGSHSHKNPSALFQNPHLRLLFPRLLTYSCYQHFTSYFKVRLGIVVNNEPTHIHSWIAVSWKLTLVL